MEALRSAYDSGSEPDANSKPLASVNDAAVAQVDAAGTRAGAGSQAQAQWLQQQRFRGKGAKHKRKESE
eukprot:5744154-Prymnesium_polylepis.1